jgi:hypothetical protein
MMRMTKRRRGRECKQWWKIAQEVAEADGKWRNSMEKENE